jgi:LAO/AO transport system kinase
MKAGLMEIGDIFVINKSDRPGADNLAVQLQGVLQMNPRYASAMPPVLLTCGMDGKGVTELVEAVRAKQLILSDSDLEARRREKRNLEFEEILKWVVIQEWKGLVGSDEKLKNRLSEVEEGSKDPYTMIGEIFPDGCIRPLTV